MKAGKHGYKTEVIQTYKTAIPKLPDVLAAARNFMKLDHGIDGMLHSPKGCALADYNLTMDGSTGAWDILACLILMDVGPVGIVLSL